MNYNQQYKKLLNEILKEGVWRNDPNRKNVKKLQIPYYSHTIDLRKEFPLLSLKKININHIITELQWMMLGHTNISYLIKNNCNIWNKDAYNYYKKEMTKRNRPVLDIKTYIRQVKDSGILVDSGFPFGDLGKIYGYQYRHLEVDQIKGLIHTLVFNPLASSMVVNAWNSEQLYEMGLNPCHYSFQVVCEPFEDSYYIDLTYNMRSSDVLLG